MSTTASRRTSGRSSGFDEVDFGLNLEDLLKLHVEYHLLLLDLLRASVNEQVLPVKATLERSDPSGASDIRHQ